MIEKIINDGEIIAIVIFSDFHGEGVNFFTPPDFSQQLAFMKREKNYKIPAHYHNKVKRDIHFTQEVLIIRSGSMRVDLYSSKLKFIKSIILKKDDVILLASGGHSFTMMEDTEFIEVKQGPYSPEKDKTIFKGIDDE